MNGWWIVLAGLGFLALCVAFDAWWLNSARRRVENRGGTEP